MTYGGPAMSAKILVVDDDPRLRELVRFTLARAGFTVHEAADGVEALALVDRLEPDLLVLDVLMPELDGLSVCRQVRARRPTPIVFLSTRGDWVDRVTGLDSGADDYLPKPFTPAELVSRVRAVLRRVSPAPADAVEVDTVRLDPGAHRVAVAGTPVDLTLTEFRILEALLRRPGQVVTRAQMVTAMYGGPHHVSPRTLDSHVRGVRQKLRDKGVDRVGTVTSVGWRWG